MDDKPEKGLGLFDYIGIINFKKPVPDNLDGFEPYITNIAFSNLKETILYANMINVDCDKQLVFDFYYYGLSKKKRFGKWPKKSKQESAKKDLLNRIVEHYKCSFDTAETYYSILSASNQLDIFADLTDKGGKT